MSYREIAKQVEMSAASIQRILEKYGDLLRKYFRPLGEDKE
jgi:transposase